MLWDVKPPGSQPAPDFGSVRASLSPFCLFSCHVTNNGRISLLAMSTRGSIVAQPAMAAVSAPHHVLAGPYIPPQDTPSRALMQGAGTPDKRPSSSGSDESVYIDAVESHDQNDSNTEPQPPEPAAAPVAASSATTPPITTPHRDVWGDPEPVPASTTNQLIFHRAPFAWGTIWRPYAWERRFFLVVPKLRRLVEQYLQLIDLTNRPVYEPRMVGRSPDDARPAVLVRCRDIEFKRIRNLFHAKAEGPLCLGKEPTLSSLIPWLDSQAERTAPSGPRLQLVYYRTTRSPFIPATLSKPLLVSLGVSKVACGGIVRYGERSATLGVAVDVGDKIGILTVDHLFPPEEAHQEEAHQRSSTSDDGSRCPNSPIFSDYDDGEYGDLDCPDAEPSRPLQHDSETADLTEISGAEEPEGEPARWEWKLLANSADPAVATYLDWALIYPESATPEASAVQLNTVLPTGNEGDAVILREMHRAPTFHLAPVYVVSGIRGVLGGQILQVASILPGGKADEESCQAWTVILDEPKSRGEHFPNRDSNVSSP